VILVAGEALVDLVVDPAGRVEASLGGGPFNLARAAARLGGEVELLTSLSTDRFGAALHDQLIADGVRMSWATRTELPTTLAVAELDAGGSARYRFYADATSAPQLLPDAAVLGAHPAVLVTGGLGLVLEPMADTIESLVASMPRSTLVCLDLNVRPFAITDRARYLARLAALLTRADLVKVSDEDLEHLGVDLGLDLGPDGAAGLLAMGPPVVIVTRGGGGTDVVTPHGTRHVLVAPLAATLVDTIGAGDTFTAGLVVALLEGGLPLDLGVPTAPDRLADAVAAAHLAAGVVVTRRGADPPRRGDLPAVWPSTQSAMAP
jgi:fructokinase